MEQRKEKHKYLEVKYWHLNVVFQKIENREFYKSPMPINLKIQIKLQNSKIYVTQDILKMQILVPVQKTENLNLL